MAFTVSVIMPCYNAGRWISQAIESVARQTLACHELIVIDDGSSDDSLEKIAASPIPLKLLHTDRANAAGARNAGIDAATGQWIAFLDADDIWYPHHLQWACDGVGQGGDVAYLAHCDFLLHDQDREVAAPPYALAQARGGLTDRQFLQLWADGGHFPNSGVVARRDRILEVGAFDPRQVRRHDFELFLRIVHGRTWAYQPKPAWRYRVGTPQAISRSEVSCWYFALRGVLKNQQAYRGPVMDAMVRKCAKAAMTTAFLRGDGNDRRRAFELAAPCLGAGRRLFYRAAALCPAVYPMIYQLVRGKAAAEAT